MEKQSDCASQIQGLARPEQPRRGGCQVEHEGEWFMRHLGKWLLALGLLAITPAVTSAGLWGN